VIVVIVLGCDLELTIAAGTAGFTGSNPLDPLTCPRSTGAASPRPGFQGAKWLSALSRWKQIGCDRRGVIA